MIASTHRFLFNSSMATKLIVVFSLPTQNKLGDKKTNTSLNFINGYNSCSIKCIRYRET